MNFGEKEKREEALPDTHKRDKIESYFSRSSFNNKSIDLPIN